MTGLAVDVAAWSSPWRHRSPGDKLLLTSGLLSCALVLPPWPGGVLVTVVSVVAALGPGRVRWRWLVSAAVGPVAFIVLGSVSLAVGWRSTPSGIGHPTVTAQTLAAAAQTAGHAMAGSAALLLLATTTPVSHLLDWARARGLPEVVCDIAGLVYRLLFVVLSTTQAVRQAQTARLGYAGRAATMRSAAGLTAAVLVRSWSRARRLEEGLAGRGMDGALRVLAEASPSSPRFLIAATGVLGGIVALSWSDGLWSGAW